ncbi:hypothetical protein LEP1GSC103_2831 [Leptospira borgpetersenii serovar Javanica str. UI 09931]|uniref:Uncharacterized protein n=4 Tax=Leptospira borgpetersenii TaxID=174 RepID=M3FBR2_LEPBO|nr:hypothetical protein LBBP_00364 [Leptospira borgpetersenii serovar Ballum]EKP13237.1 hypothetical protein LEP1GSC128_3260 [Leptospira borgpetersenii str. 200801926]EKQ91907.1 hypothetical protein LEP1GSC101_3176 [Leptospira borgpetersenii str. UI 09149]EKQ98824.1 hypothetical protein LEP1GSC121_0619 [Leptospira borgpetersenii serovar Castellonis str. 200801910]EMF99342.1 hypothetical protein LEP1GSC123_4596 [Leptospira borgpetersenii str. 200701203]EMK13235.1 hypothetical protein LEP1GSC066
MLNRIKIPLVLQNRYRPTVLLRKFLNASSFRQNSRKEENLLLV